MAIDPKAREVTLTYPGGTVTAKLGIIQAIFGPQQIRWNALSAGPALPGGNTRRKYGTRQRSSAAGGRQMFVRLDSGEVWSVRQTGTVIKFIDAVIARSAPGKVLNVWTPRGTIYGPQAGELA